MQSQGVARLDPPPNAEALLAGLDLLALASEDDVRAVAEVVDWWQCDAGAELFAAGDDADGMYLVVRGRLESHVDGAVLGEIARGGTFGETALLGGVRRTATIRALRDSVVVRLPPERVPLLATSSPGVSLGLARLVATRAAAGPRPIRGVPAAKSIGVVSLDGSDVADELADDLSGRLMGLALTRRRFGDDLTGWEAEGGPANLVARLAEAEDGCDALVVTLPPLERGADRTLHTTSLRQMDVLVGVARGSGRPDPLMLDLIGAVARPASVVLLHRRGRTPSMAGRWLDAVGAQTALRGLSHVHEGESSDLDRLARALVGRSIGVVLGGGGSRGFAHIGVLRALCEAGIPIDRIGGSSMGAVMGAQLAMGWTPEEMLDRNIAAWSRRRLLEFGLPTLSLLRGRHGLRVLEGFFGDRRIEDLWLDFFCTTVDLSACRLNVRRTGPVAPWVAASATVPGLWPPLVDDDGHLHVDGGMLNNVPTDIMRASHPGIVIGVDVCHRQDPMRVVPSAALPTGMALLRARQRGQWYPSILDVVNRSNLLASLQHHEQAEQHADLYISPPVEDEGFAAFDRVSQLADIGYRAAAQALERSTLTLTS